MSRFDINGITYEVDKFGVVNQLNPQPFQYDPAYCAIYDTPEYQRGNEQLQAMRVAFIAGTCYKPDSILDFGSGNGAFVRYAQQYFTNVAGYDISGADIKDIHMVKSVQPAHVITMWDALEHVPSLSILSDLPCQYLVISLPWCHYHEKGPVWMQTKYKHLKPNEHVHHFNEGSLRASLHYYGWDHIQTSNHEDIVRKSAHGLPNILTAAFKRRPYRDNPRITPV